VVQGVPKLTETKGSRHTKRIRRAHTKRGREV
jgi:hypothetical protein